MKIDQLYPVDQKDADKLTDLLTQCFAEDPLYCQLIPQKTMRKRLLPGLFQCDLDELFQTCHVYADSPEMNGIIIVSDETEPQNGVRRRIVEMFASWKTAALLLEEDPSCKTLWNFIRGQEYLNSEWTEDLGEAPRLLEMFASWKTAALLLEEDPSCKTLWNFIRGQEYLNSEWTEDLGEAPRLHVVYFAVRPSKRGQGVASRLMKAVLAFADENGMEVSLETHNQRNLEIYRHYGFHLFEVVKKHFPLKQFCMVRPSEAAQGTLAAS